MDEQNGEAVARVRSVSGRPIGQMSSLGVHLEMPDSQYMEHLAAVASAMTLNSPMVGVVSRKHEQFVKDCGLLIVTVLYINPFLVRRRLGALRRSGPSLYFRKSLL